MRSSVLPEVACDLVGDVVSEKPDGGAERPWCVVTVVRSDVVRCARQARPFDEESDGTLRIEAAMKMSHDARAAFENGITPVNSSSHVAAVGIAASSSRLRARFAVTVVASNRANGAAAAAEPQPVAALADRHRRRAPPSVEAEPLGAAGDRRSEHPAAHGGDLDPARLRIDRRR